MSAFTSSLTRARSEAFPVAVVFGTPCTFDWVSISHTTTAIMSDTLWNRPRFGYLTLLSAHLEEAQMWWHP